jgi:hypothetical protein
MSASIPNFRNAFTPAFDAALKRLSESLWPGSLVPGWRDPGAVPVFERLAVVIETADSHPGSQGPYEAEHGSCANEAGVHLRISSMTCSSRRRI